MASISGLIENDQFLFDLYDGLPSFEEINLHQMVLNWDGPRAILVFDLNSFPLNPPKKWHKFNTTQVELSLFPLLGVNLEKFSNGNICNLLVDRRKDLIYVYATGGSQAQFIASSAQIVGFSAYFNSPQA